MYWLDNLIDALIDVIEAKRIRDKAFENCGYSHDDEERLKEAKESFAEILTVFVDERIRKAK